MPAAAPTSRFTIERRFKRAHVWRPSNPTGMVADGFTITDTLTGSARRCETKREAVRERERVLENEAAIEWPTLAGWRAWFGGRSSSGLLEVWGVDAAGKHTNMLFLVQRSQGDEDAGTRAVIANYLKVMGHPLPERPL